MARFRFCSFYSAAYDYGKHSIFAANQCGDFKMQMDRAGAARRGWILCFNKRSGSRMLKEAMMLVLETNGSLLYLFSSGAEAESHLEAIDIENGEYEFCDDTGQRFVGEIIAPVTKFRAGGFRLKPDGVPDKAVVASFLFRARSLERACGDVKSLNDLRRAHGA
jgi:hypothetical protein